MAQESGDRIPVKCPHCGAGYDVPVEKAGRAVSCEHCRRSFTAPFVASLAGRSPDRPSAEEGALAQADRQESDEKAGGPAQDKAGSTAANVREVVRAIHGLERETAAVADGTQKTGRAMRFIALLVLIQFALSFLTGLYVACSGGT